MNTLLKFGIYVIVIFLEFSNTFAQVPVNELIAKYPFNSTMKDETGNGNNAISKGATFTENRFSHFNRAIKTSNSYIILGTLDQLSSSLDSFSFSFWMKSELPQVNTVVFGSTNNQGAGMHLAFGVKPDTSAVFTLRSKDGKTLRFLSQFNRVFDSSWHHVVICVGNSSKNTVFFYIDGKLEQVNVTHSMSPSSFEQFTNPLTLGAWNNRGKVEQFFNGCLDDLRIYGRSLSSEDVTALYGEGMCFKTVYDTSSISVTDTLIINVSNLFVQSTTSQFIRIYPNPTNKFITVSTTHLAQQASFKLYVYNPTGQLVKSVELDNNQKTVQLSDLSGSGVYTVHLLDADDKIIRTKKIILQ